jgi:hypothetical protein
MWFQSSQKIEMISVGDLEDPFFSHLISRAKQGYDVQLPLTKGNVTQTKPQLLQY